MTLFFDLEILEAETKLDPAYMVIGLEKFWKKQRVPKNIYEAYKPIKKLKAGNSFLLNPAGFFADKNVDWAYRAQYIRLAGRRDYLLYKTYRVKTLNLLLYPDLALDKLSTNPLLKITDTEIHFKHEEI